MGSRRRRKAPDGGFFIAKSCNLGEFGEFVQKGVDKVHDICYTVYIVNIK